MAFTSLGGKSPADKKKRPPPSMLAISVGVGKPKDSAAGSPSEPPPMPKAAPKPPTPPMPSSNPRMDENDPAPKKAGAAWFTNQDETCAKCEYFDGSNCTKGVPEADYSVSDPASSRCRFWEGKESPMEQAAEGEGEESMEGIPA